MNKLEKLHAKKKINKEIKFNTKVSTVNKYEN